MSEIAKISNRQFFIIFFLLNAVHPVFLHSFKTRGLALLRALKKFPSCNWSRVGAREAIFEEFREFEFFTKILSQTPTRDQF